MSQFPGRTANRARAGRGLGGGSALVVGLALLGATGACGDRSTGASASASAAPSGWADDPSGVAPRPGMRWIPAGTLVAGTPSADVPRVPDAELPGARIAMSGFYIDVYPHPNEAGALPTTNVTHAEAVALCEAQGKRLCTELELERACKGPENARYPYGATYRADACETGKKRGTASPNGFHSACVSGFGVHDTHGGVWTWTASPWGRGTEGLVAVRGGNDLEGELVGRCAHARAEPPTSRAADLGVRCCAGEPNAAKVELAVDRGPELRLLLDEEPLRASLERAVRGLASLDDAAPATLGASPVANDLVVERVWRWRPAGNEALLLAGGCSGRGDDKACGVLVAREGEGAPAPMAFVSSGRWQPTIGRAGDPRTLHVHGGDLHGAFRKRLSYEWGRMGLGGVERKKQIRQGAKRIDVWESKVGLGRD